jgi:soluble cytochrome b562
MENRRSWRVVSGRMKNPIFLAVFAAVSLIPLTVSAQDKHTKLHEQMEKMDDAYKAFRKETDPAKGAELAREAQKYAIEGLAEVPELVKDIKDPAEKAKSAVLYKKLMAKLIVSLCEVEEAFLGNNLEEVEKIIDSLKSLKKEGHDKFMPEE